MCSGKSPGPDKWVSGIMMHPSNLYLFVVTDQQRIWLKVAFCHAADKKVGRKGMIEQEADFFSSVP